ncbi:MAG: hypothetical protein JO256_00710 [Alphaproteobacteria bacterium]|nr:hypothetical protein [Alphaproteobacteria bacterium]
MPPEIRAILVAAAICFVCYRIYSRVRGSIGRQRLQPAWLILRALLLLLACGLAFSFSPGDMSQSALYVIAGALIGAAIAGYALRHTEVERTELGYFYTGHPYIGLGIVGLFVTRLLYVFTIVFSRRHEIAAQAKAHGGTIGNALAQSEGGPVTLGVLTLMTSYYVVYALGLLRKAK